MENQCGYLNFIAIYMKVRKIYEYGVFHWASHISSKYLLSGMCNLTGNNLNTRDTGACSRSVAWSEIRTAITWAPISWIPDSL